MAQFNCFIRGQDIKKKKKPDSSVVLSWLSVGLKLAKMVCSVTYYFSNFYDNKMSDFSQSQLKIDQLWSSKKK